MAGGFSALVIVWDIVSKFFYYFFLLLWKFYTQFLPFLIIYIGIPLFVIGVLLALSFSGGMILIIVGFAIGLWFLVKHGIINSDPYLIKSNSNNKIVTNQKIHKSTL